MKLSSSITIKEAKEKDKAAKILLGENNYYIMAVGDWVDSLGNPIFCGLDGVLIKDIKTKWVLAWVDNKLDTIKPDGFARIEFRYDPT